MREESMSAFYRFSGAEMALENAFRYSGIAAFLWALRQPARHFDRGRASAPLSKPKRFPAIFIECDLLCIAFVIAP
jgi:hypothetical protein